MNAPIMPKSDDFIPIVCALRGCKINHLPLFKCVNRKCNRIVHHHCSKIILAKNKLDDPTGGAGATTLQLDVVDDEIPIVICRKKCYVKTLGKKSIGHTHLRWNEDGKLGPSDPNNSEKILLDWLATEGNYAKYIGGKQTNGISKRKYHDEISNIIKKAGCRVNRTGDMIRFKIKHIEKTFSSAYDFTHSVTGAGIQENDPGSFEDAVKKICPYFYEIFDVMIDRSSTPPAVTTETLFATPATTTTTNHNKEQKRDEDESEVEDERDDHSSLEDATNHDSDGNIEIAKVLAIKMPENEKNTSTRRRVGGGTKRSLVDAEETNEAKDQDEEGDENYQGRSKIREDHGLGDVAISWANVNTTTTTMSAESENARPLLMSPPLTVIDKTNNKPFLAKNKKKSADEAIFEQRKLRIEAELKKHQLLAEETRRRKKFLEEQQLIDAEIERARKRDEIEFQKKMMDVKLSMERAEAVKTIVETYGKTCTGQMARKMFPHLSDFIHDDDFKPY